MISNTLIPHFVADRPMSLRILAGLPFERHPVKVGLMLQACTTENFRAMASQFPCGDLEYCGVVDGKCPFDGDFQRCTKGQLVRECITKIADSGVFTKNGAILDYPELFERYNQMNIERGIMLDVLGDWERTVDSAEVAMNTYSSLECNFKLVGVAQGKSLSDYLRCYEKLKKMGFEEIAIGGLLTKRENTARFASSNREHIAEIVKAIKSEWPDDRVFCLGVYNPKRHEFLESIGADAADYKGWIFQYKKKYQDPRCHHVHRIYQTRCFIETNILSPLSGVTASCDPINTTAEKIKHHISSLNTKVVVKRDQREVNPAKPIQITVISCGKRKNKGVKCLAKDAYSGRAFLLKRKYAELSNSPWFILSAKYGLIRPDRSINPDYDVTIKTKAECQEFAQKLKRQIPQYLEFTMAEEIVFLGPSSYLKSLELALEGKDRITIKHLTKGLKQGQSQKKIKAIISGLTNASETHTVSIASLKEN
ncbi:DUF6884 domain-containing protein [Methanoculleus sp.]|uniref:DUF6884 domain-containing protein n=1 Tax=Methanoculleus sp. TaxID=90427 RepID=UPI0025E505D2|nr:DUF6884 domain-containing protein [Methanoculleus sp.]